MDLILLSKGLKVLETAAGAVLVPTRFSLVRISIRDTRLQMEIPGSP